MNKGIYIGYTNDEIEEIIRAAVEANQEIDHVVYFSKDGDKTVNIQGVEVECRSWGDVILYKYFYPLLDKIRSNYLLVFDDMMRTQKRNDLTYNCAHHYVNQTDNVLVFETFPMIENPQDFMILVDYIFPDRFKGQQLTSEILQSQYVHIKPYSLTIDSVDIEISDDLRADYETAKAEVFASVEDGKSPDTIPRQLHVWAGTHCKRDYIKDGVFLARNKRFKSKEVITYKDKTDAETIKIIDFPTRMINFLDFVKANDVHAFEFINTGLSIDTVYYGQYRAWLETLQEVFYDKASV